MAFEYFPAAAEEKIKEAPKPNWLVLVSIFLFLALLMAISYIIWEKNKTISQLQQQSNNVAATPNINSVVATPVIIADVPISPAIKDSLQKALIEMTTRYDVLKSMTGQANGMINDRDSSINAKTDYLKKLLAKVNAGNAELNEAKKLITNLNTDIETYKTQIETLKGEKIELFQQKQMAVQEISNSKKRYDSAATVIKQKNDIIDIATTLNASAFNIISIREKNNGSEVSTIVAKRVDKLRISFEVGENHVATSGVKDLYVCITGPDGTPISVEALGSGKFTTRNAEAKFYTQKLEVNYIQGNRQTISFDWRQNSVFETGLYKIEVYNNGFKIGEGIRVLKKGGIFS